MHLQQLLGSLRRMQFNLYTSYDLLYYDDDSQTDFKYIFLAKTSVIGNLQRYVDINMELSSVWLLDHSIIQSPDLEMAFLLNNSTDEALLLDIGAGKSKLPGIWTNGVAYTTAEIDNAVTQYITANIGIDDDEPAVEKTQWMKPQSVCDCGGHSCGYADDELHGHSGWCKVHGKKN